jgi:hypothetical protein
MRHIRAILIAMAGILLLLVPAVRADSLQLKNGNFVQGRYLGGTERAVQFEVNGRIRLYGIDEILSISFAAASADGGIPSNSVGPKPSADTASNSAARGNCGLRAAFWNPETQPKVPGQQINSEQGRYSAGANPRVGRPVGSLRSNRTVEPTNSDVKTRVSAIPTRAVRVLPPRFPVLSD